MNFRYTESHLYLEDTVNNIQLYCTRVSNFNYDLYYQKLLKSLPDTLQYKNKQIKNKHSKIANLLGKALLKRALVDKNKLELIEDIRKTPSGKPLLNDTVWFNISHSADYVLCAIALNFEIGVDVELYKDFDFSKFKKIMTCRQWGDILVSKNQIQCFFDLWTMKESISKATGEGLNASFLKMEVGEGIDETMVYKDTCWYLHRVVLDNNYSVCIAAERKSSIDIINVNF